MEKKYLISYMIKIEGGYKFDYLIIDEEPVLEEAIAFIINNNQYLQLTPDKIVILGTSLINVKNNKSE